MHIRIVHRSRGSFAFQLALADGTMALTGAPQRDVEACVQAIRELITSLRERVVKLVRADIVSGRSGPGTMYSVPALAAELEVSTTPVREALLDLTNSGFLTPIRNRGFRVEGMTRADLDHLFDARERAALEWTEALTQLPPHGVPDAIYDSVRAWFDEKEMAALIAERKRIDAVLFDPKAQMPPSDLDTIRHFQRIAELLGLGVEVITKQDFDRIPEFDALWIRENTNIDHHTFRFAKRAEQVGLVVVDQRRGPRHVVVIQLADRFPLYRWKNATGAAH